MMMMVVVVVTRDAAVHASAKCMHVRRKHTLN